MSEVDIVDTHAHVLFLTTFLGVRQPEGNQGHDIRSGGKASAGRRAKAGRIADTAERANDQTKGTTEMVHEAVH